MEEKSHIHKGIRKTNNNKKTRTEALIGVYVVFGYGMGTCWSPHRPTVREAFFVFPPSWSLLLDRLLFITALCGAVGPVCSCVFAPSLSRGCQKSNQQVDPQTSPPPFSSLLLFVYKVNQLTTTLPDFLTFNQRRCRRSKEIPTIPPPSSLISLFFPIIKQVS